MIKRDNRSYEELITNCIIAELEQSERQPKQPQLSIELPTDARPTVPAPPHFPADVNFW